VAAIIIIGGGLDHTDVRQLVAGRRHFIFQPAKFCDRGEKLLERPSVIEREFAVSGA
jgi:hypothetical protein